MPFLATYELPFLATSQSCHMWQLYVLLNLFLPEIGKPKFWQFWQLYKAAIFGNFTKLPYLATLRSWHYWQLHKAAICGNYICCQIWQQWSANFGTSLEVIIFHVLAIIGTLSCFKKCLSQATFQNWHKFPCPFIVTY